MCDYMAESPDIWSLNFEDTYTHQPYDPLLSSLRAPTSS